MTREDKQLLLKDLSARLPYGVKYCRDSWNYEWDQEISVVEVLEDIDKDGYINYHKVYKIDDIKPYLRTMSSMTSKEWVEFCDCSAKDEASWVMTENHQKFIPFQNREDYLNSKHFDYRGLIEKGLALEAPEGMYKTE